MACDTGSDLTPIEIAAIEGHEDVVDVLGFFRRAPENLKRVLSVPDTGPAAAITQRISRPQRACRLPRKDGTTECTIQREAFSAALAK